MATLEFDEVSKVFDNGVHAVRDLSLTVADGEFVVLVGPSGCGKTTALRMLAGLERITAGEIRIGGVRVNDVQPRDRDVAMVFQNYALYPHMSVYDNIGFGLRVRHIPKPERRARIERAAAILGLTEQLNRKPSQLSGGQRQRVAMGRAIVREPRAFLMDEPLSNLDARLRVQMRTEIARIQHELGVTTVYVTHDQVEAMTMADRVAVLRGGVLQQLDTPQRVYAEPANLFVATFIGSPAMNVVEAQLRQGDGGLECRIGDLRPPAARRHPDRAARARPRGRTDGRGGDSTRGRRRRRLTTTAGSGKGHRLRRARAPRSSPTSRSRPRRSYARRSSKGSPTSRRPERLPRPGGPGPAVRPSSRGCPRTRRWSVTRSCRSRSIPTRSTSSTWTTDALSGPEWRRNPRPAPRVASISNHGLSGGRLAETCARALLKGSATATRAPRGRSRARSILPVGPWGSSSTSSMRRG